MHSLLDLSLDSLLDLSLHWLKLRLGLSPEGRLGERSNRPPCLFPSTLEIDENTPLDRILVATSALAASRNHPLPPGRLLTCPLQMQTRAESVSSEDSSEERRWEANELPVTSDG